MTFNVNSPGHVVEHNRLAALLPDGFVPMTSENLDTESAALVADPSSATATQLSATIGAATTAAQGVIRGNGFVALGDSISTAADAGSAGAGYGGSWPNLVCALSQQRFNFLGNAGVGGNNSTQILARVPNAIALGPRIVTVLAGTNDLTQGVPFSTWSANIKAIVAQLRAAGIRVVLCTIPPRDNTTYLATQMTWNQWLRVYAQQQGLDLLDFFALLVNPTTGIWASGYDSGLPPHPSQAAHLVMANYVISQLTISPFSPIQAQLATGDVGNMLANGMLLGSGTPGSWITSGSTSSDYTEGVVTDSDFIGQAWQVAYANVASASTFRQFKSFAVSNGFSAGDTLVMCAKAKITASSGVTPGTTAGLRFQIIFTGGSPGTWTPVAADAQAHAAGLMWFKTIVPAGTTSIQLSTIVGTLPVASNFTVRVGQFGLFNLTALGLAGTL